MKRILKQGLERLGLLGTARSIRRTGWAVTPGGFRERRENRLLRERMLRFYSQFMKEGDLVFDVGANIGNRTEIFLKLGARVVAIEPQEECLYALRRHYGKNRRVSIVPKGLAGREGEQEMAINTASILSSMSKEWMAAVKETKRFSNPYHWEWVSRRTVPVTTLDRLIEDHGVPVFCKIDVEGFEFEVLQGLSRPLGMLSFEFTPEFIDATIQCILRLTELGRFEFNYSIGESMVWALSHWMGSPEICEALRTLPDKTIFGDVYARLEGKTPP